MRSGALLAGLASTQLPLSARGTAADDPGASPAQGGGFYRFNIGDFRATVISDGHGTIPFWPVFAANAPERTVQDFLKAKHLKAANQFTSNMLVVDTGRERILVDTGFGEVLGPKFGNFSSLRANLLRAGITTDSIDVVVVTHGHIDHIAGITDKSGALAFPKARYAIAEKEWLYWTGSRFESDINGGPMSAEIKQGTIFAAKTNLPPIASKLQVLKADGEVTNGVNLVPAPGHSPAQSAVLFTSGNEQLLHWADVAHNSVTGLQRPEWTSVFDYDAAQTVKTRKAMLDRVATDRALVMGYHFPFPAIGYVEKLGGAYHWNAASWNW
jgi:glyoxylase-like metal-dependent hydrolase (beta-lactamase superfamily II)